MKQRVSDLFRRRCLFVGLAAVLAFLGGQMACAGESARNAGGKGAFAGKPAGSIEVSYALAEKNDPGSKIPVTLSLRLLADADSVTLEVAPETGLTVVSGGDTREYGSRARGFAASETVTVLAEGDGRFYLNVFVTAVLNGKKQGQSLSVPVNVGTAVSHFRKAAPSYTTDSQGRKLIIMQPQEK